jgi:hypothetical protein
MGDTLPCGRAIVCAWFSVALFVDPTYAFESDEHEQLGNAAFAVALEFLKVPAESPVRRLYGRPGKYRSADREERDRLSYGDVTSCVDYFFSPEKMLADAWREGRRRPGMPSLPSPDEAVLVLEQCHKTGPSFALATHSNHSHFRHDLLMAYRLYHVAAISAARDDKSPFAGLVINAIADHYLHDFFAPGHIFTVRDRLTDVPATAVHDIWNKDGADFRPMNTQQLKPLAEFICGGSVQSCALHEGIPLGGIVGRAPAADVGAALAGILAGKPVRLKGDAMLGDEEPDRLRQRLLMLLIQAQSVIDVLSGTNSFREMAWEGNKFPTAAKIPFGEYLLGDAAAREGGQAPSDAPIPLVWKNPIVMAAVQREAMIAGTRFGRTVFTVETPLVVLPARHVTFLPLIGLGYHYEGNLDGGGPTFRIVAAIPETELALSAYARNFTYPTTNEGDKRVLNGGIRLDSGFTSYFTAFISIGRDTATTQEGTLRHGVIFAAGFQFAFPLSRIFPRGSREMVAP